MSPAISMYSAGEVAAGLAPAFKIVIDDLPESRGPEAWKVPAMHDLDLKRE
jgi:hypothetical protein